ncbi:hypothetical protein Ahy_B01g052783 isoform B [Arachis hypogaea]|uniref:MACPF domain-containing protein n=1 Tax=Arachis hypogaea TaxID=3818 RepID=A0A445AQC9_ARAHY|nr:hypothetical protein Ahy_B01g052783 isoform B [Arachis hypogaea]
MKKKLGSGNGVGRKKSSTSSSSKGRSLLQTDTAVVTASASAAAAAEMAAEMAAKMELRRHQLHLLESSSRTQPWHRSSIFSVSSLGVVHPSPSSSSRTQPSSTENPNLHHATIYLTVATLHAQDRYQVHRCVSQLAIPLAVLLAILTINLAAICTPADYNTRPLDTIYSNFIDALPVGVGGRGKRLVVLDEMHKRDIFIRAAGGASITIRGVSENIPCDKGDRIRFKSDVLEFNQILLFLYIFSVTFVRCQSISELLNQKSAVQGKIPSGYFNALIDLSGDWLRDAADIKYLAFDGYFILLYYLHLTASPLVLQEEVKKSVPAQWDPTTLSRFIQTYGTHIVVGMAVGGQDVICVKQKHSSKISPDDLRRHLEDLGDFLFSDVRSPSLLQRQTADGKQKSSQDQGDTVDFSGPLISQMHIVHEILERHERHIRRTIQRLCKNDRTSSKR